MLSFNLDHISKLVVASKRDVEEIVESQKKKQKKNHPMEEELLSLNSSVFCRLDTSFVDFPLPPQGNIFYSSAIPLTLNDIHEVGHHPPEDPLDSVLSPEYFERIKLKRMEERIQLGEQKKERRRKRKGNFNTPVYHPITVIDPEKDGERRYNQKLPEMDSVFDSGQFTAMNIKKSRENKKKQKRKLKEMKEKEENNVEKVPNPPVEEEVELDVVVRKITGPSEGIIVEQKWHQLWIHMAQDELVKSCIQWKNNRRNHLLTHKKRAVGVQEEVFKKLKKVKAAQNNANSRCKKLSSKIGTYLRKNEGKVVEQRKKRQALQNEKERQAKKLNYLLTKTELYSHFMAKRVDAQDNIEDISDMANSNLNPTEEDKEMMQSALKDAKKAMEDQINKTIAFEKSTAVHRSDNVMESTDDIALIKDELDVSDIGLIQEPRIFKGELKIYQKKGLTWLVNLYNHSINGILADEMGLGKTVQTIAFLTYLAETKGIWGPFLVIAPKSTLPNWAREVTTFTDHLKILPYWGNKKQRTTLRKFMVPNMMYSKNAAFHVLITSYHLIVQDFQYFKDIKWEYMILDEAQAIKSAQSQRWNSLLNLKECRNRLLLTGTPIQNNMAELWALLHFIMPTLFDNHAEFADWFSKDIESHAENKASLNKHQLNRLYMVLKPFMLRRVKKDVLNEMPPKSEIELKCSLTPLQQHLYDGIKKRLSIADLLGKARAGKNLQHLMNLVMQFRKVCNHPEILERKKMKSPLCIAGGDWGSADNKVVVVGNSSFFKFSLPRIVYRECLFPNFLNRLCTGFFDTFHEKWLFNRLSIFSRRNIVDSLRPKESKSKDGEYLEPVSDCWSFLRFIDKSPSDIEEVWSFDNLLARWNNAFQDIQHSYALRFYAHNEFTDIECDYSSDITPVNTYSRLLIYNVFGNMSQANLHLSPNLAGTIKTVEDRLFELKHIVGSTKIYLPSTTCPLIKYECSDIQFQKKQNQLMYNPWMTKVICGKNYNGPFQKANLNNPMIQVISSTRLPTLNPQIFGLCKPLFKKISYADLYFPRYSDLVASCGKMKLLDKLLFKLKKDRHRVLVYSQMTTMLDILEDFLGSRGYKYVRLDGQCSLDDRRDVVDLFQTDDSIFVFLLSTRAGGLGINLTAADTVIFYDSDWNPTIDSQAMDRAHRLGQTKPVTVYRLITQKTVEERIIVRAKQKSTIQNLVIEGGNFEMSDEQIWSESDVIDLLIDDENPGAQKKRKHNSFTGFVPRKKRSPKKPVAAKERNPNPLSSKELFEPTTDTHKTIRTPSTTLQFAPAPQVQFHNSFPSWPTPLQQ